MAKLNIERQRLIDNFKYQNPSLDQLNNDFIIGQIEGDGSFYVTFSENFKIKAGFQELYPKKLYIKEIDLFLTVV